MAVFIRNKLNDRDLARVEVRSTIFPTAVERIFPSDLEDESFEDALRVAYEKVVAKEDELVELNATTNTIKQELKA